MARKHRGSEPAHERRPRDAHGRDACEEGLEGGGIKQAGTVKAGPQEQVPQGCLHARLLHRLGRHAGGERRADQAPHARADEHVDGQPRGAEHLEGADVGEAARAARA